MNGRAYVPILTVASVMILWLFLLYVPPVQAHNGKVALAVPVEGIVVDGDLSDWPDDMVWYPILLPEHGLRPKDGKDSEGRFRIGYNAKENALYVGVEVRDESTVIDTTAEAEWDTQDGCEVYVDVAHKEKYSPAVQYVIWGNQRGLRGSRDVQVEVNREGENHQYEWRMDIGGIGRGQVHLHSGMVLGFDVVVCDKDKDGSFSVMAWGKYKSSHTGELGDVLLIAEDAGIGWIRGRVRWQGKDEGVARGKVKIQSLDSEALCVRLETDREGRYAMEVPEGRYRVEVGIGRGKRDGVVVEVRERKTEEVELVVKTPRGLVVEAGRGRVAKAGVGVWQGFWQTFDVPDGLPFPCVYDILQDREGHLWFGTAGGGVSRYDGEQFVSFTAEDGLAYNWVCSILEDRQGHLWFGTWGGGMSRYDGEQLVTFTTEDGLAGNSVFSILEDREGHLWFGTAGGGVSRYDGEHFTTFTTDDGLVGNLVSSIVEDREGYLWFGIYGTGGGVSRYDGEQFVSFTAEDGLAHNWVHSIVEDREGHLWFGTEGGGVSRYDWEEFVTFTSEEGLAHNWVRSILEDQEGYLWFGTGEAGVSRYNGEQFVTFTSEEGLAHNSVWFILEDREGHLWFGTWGGVSRYDGQQFIIFTTNDGLAHNSVRSIMEDREGHLWFGTEGGGMSRYDGEQFVTFTTEDGLAGNRVWCILEDREGHLWFGTEGGGVSRYDGEQFVTFTTEDGLAHNWVRSILEDQKGYLWFGTYGGGVSRYDGEQFVTSTIEEGLAGNVVLSILEDREGYLWFGTAGGGVSRYDGFVFQNLLRRDGLANNIITDMLQDRNGDIWIATVGGITRYRPRHISPPIFLTDVLADCRYGPVKEIRLPSSQSFLVFEFRGMSLKTRPGQMVYMYRLEGYDRHWRQTREGRVEYTDLPRGEYVFQVKAVDRDLTYSEVPATVRVTIHPPYARMAVLALLGMGLVGVVVLSVYGVKRRRERDQAQQALLDATKHHEEELEKRVEQRTAQLRSLTSELSLTEQRERRRIATALHDHLGQTLAICKIKLGALQELVHSTGFSEHLNEIRKFIEQTIQYTRSLTFQLSPPILYELDFEAALEWLVEQVQEEHGIPCKFEDDGQPKPLDENVRVLLFQAVRELLVNVVKHAQTHKVEVSTWREDDRIRIRVEDDGVGFDTSKIKSHLGGTNGFGLFSIRERLDYIGGHLQVESEPGRGTRMTLEAPLKMEE